MKLFFTIILMAIWMLAFAGCGKTAEAGEVQMPLVPEVVDAAEIQPVPIPETAGVELGDAQDPLTAGEAGRLLRLAGKLYYDTGEVSKEPRCGMLDGQINASVLTDEIPTEDGQSNFGTGFGYQYGQTDETIEVNIDSEWHVFKAE